jgi:hypothetical protein
MAFSGSVGSAGAQTQTRGSAAASRLRKASTCFSFLTSEGEKAAVSTVRKLMPAVESGGTRGAAIRLYPPQPGAGPG